MSNDGARARERFFENMRKVAVGAKLARRSICWTVVKQVERETGIELQLQYGRRQFTAYVPVCHTGPVLWEAGLRPVAAAPLQRELPVGAP